MRWALLGALLCRPLPAHAATGMGGGVGDLVWHALNLAILVGAVVYFGRQPIRQYFAERRAAIRENLEGSAKLLEEAEARLAEWDRRLGQLDAEAERVHETSRSLAQAEGRRIVADAHASAERIRRDAAAAVEQEVRRARATLREEVSDLAIELAERLLRERVTDADRDRLVDEFVERVEAVRPSGGR